MIEYLFSSITSVPIKANNNIRLSFICGLSPKNIQLNIKYLKSDHLCKWIHVFFGWCTVYIITKNFECVNNIGMKTSINDILSKRILRKAKCHSLIGVVFQEHPQTEHNLKRQMLVKHLYWPT